LHSQTSKQYSSPPPSQKTFAPRELADDQHLESGIAIAMKRGIKYLLDGEFGSFLLSLCSFEAREDVYSIGKSRKMSRRVADGQIDDEEVSWKGEEDQRKLDTIEMRWVRAADQFGGWSSTAIDGRRTLNQIEFRAWDEAVRVVIHGGRHK
jgi:hypothetical protein